MGNIKIEYIKLANIQTLCSSNGNSTKANSAYKKLKKIYFKIKRKEIDSGILIELLSEDESTKLWAASHMLGLQYNTDMALSVLDDMSEHIINPSNVLQNIISSGAKITAKVYRNKGYLKF